MRGLLATAASLALLSIPSAGAEALASSGADYIRQYGPQGINLWKLDQLHEQRYQNAMRDGLVVQEAGQSLAAAEKYEEFPARWFEQPLDHFSNSSSTFGQRYWINTRHYKPGTNAPVIVLDGGETSGANRLPFLDTGIVEILTKATGGVGVVLEHRYYGQSVPVKNFSTDSLRFLNNAQSAADSANFMAHVKFPGIKEDLTAPNTPWIYYGGSYAGARSAHMRILYPELVFGAIASSAVTHASLLNWEYHEIIRNAADHTCSSNIQKSIAAVDNLLGYPRFKQYLKGLFGLAELEHDEDFVSLLSSPLGSWQAKNWDPSVGSSRFEEFCEALGSAWSADESSLHNATMLFNDETNTLTLPGGIDIPLVVYRYAQYIKKHIVSKCPEEFGVEECFGTFDDAKFQDIELENTWRLWLFQVCTEWGYFFTAPPDVKHPRIVSKLLTLEYASMTCRQAFPRGKFFTVPPMPNLTVVNELGSFSISEDRLAFIDGDVDPWKPNTPHSEHAPEREDTILRPFKVIPGGVHHYDENGLRNMAEEPAHILKIHKEMIHFVKEWLKDWKDPKSA